MVGGGKNDREKWEAEIAKENGEIIRIVEGRNIVYPKVIIIFIFIFNSSLSFHTSRVECLSVKSKWQQVSSDSQTLPGTQLEESYPLDVFNYFSFWILKL